MPAKISLLAMTDPLMVHVNVNTQCKLFSENNNDDATEKNYLILNNHKNNPPPPRGG